MPEEPTLGEAIRRLDVVAAQLAGIVDRLDRRDSYIEANFVRAGTWIESRKADQAMVANLFQDIAAEATERKTSMHELRQAIAAEATERKDDIVELKRLRKDDDSWRRQVLLALLIVTISSLVSIGLAVVSLKVTP